MPGRSGLLARACTSALCDIERPLQQQLDLAAGILEREQARGNHARVVEDQQIAGRDELRQIAHAPIGERAGGAVERQQPARRSLGERLLGYEFFGKFVGEVGAAHGGEFTAMAARDLRSGAGSAGVPGTGGTGGMRRNGRNGRHRLHESLRRTPGARAW